MQQLLFDGHQDKNNGCVPDATLYCIDCHELGVSVQVVSFPRDQIAGTRSET